MSNPCPSKFRSEGGAPKLAVSLLWLSLLSGFGFAHAAAPAACPLPPEKPLPNEAAGVDVPEGRIEAAVAKLDGLAGELLASSKIPGMAIAVVHNGRTIYAKGFGLRRIGDAAKVDADTVFQLASVSKPLGATVVARQIGEGKARWDTPVHELLPDFELSDPYVTEHVTIGDLYSHRSGLPDHAGDVLEELGYSQPKIMRQMRLLPLAPFRARYAYTNFGLTTAAVAVASAARSDWATLSREAIYLPLGMLSTSSRYADYEARSNRAHPHVKTGNGYVVAARHPHDVQSPAGGASSSVNDLARWMAMVLGEGTLDGEVVVERCALLAALSPQMSSAPPLRPQARAGYYGYGFNVSDSAAGRVTASHSGAFYLGAATAFTLIPSLDVGIVTLTNAQPIGVPEALNAEFADLVQFGEPKQDWKQIYTDALKPLLQPSGSLLDASAPKHPAPPRPLSDYVGEYRNKYYGSAKVDLVRGSLVLTLGSATQGLSVRHWDGDTFYFTPPGESAPTGSISKAVFGQDTMTIEYLDEEYPATYVRGKPR